MSACKQSYDLELAEQEVSTARVVVKLAEEQLQNEIERFKLGQGTSFQVSQFQQQQSQAKPKIFLRASVTKKPTFVCSPSQGNLRRIQPHSNKVLGGKPGCFKIFREIR